MGNFADLARPAKADFKILIFIAFVWVEQRITYIKKQTTAPALPHKHVFQLFAFLLVANCLFIDLFIAHTSRGPGTRHSS